MKQLSLLKKVFCSIVLTMLFIVSVKAFSTNLKEVKVIETNMDITNISTNDNQITDDIIFEEKDDYIVLEFTLQNNDDYKYTIENIVDNNTNENIEITYDYSKEEIKEKSQYKFKARFEYKNRLENVRQIDIDDLKITLKLIRDDGKEKDILVRNPKTGDSILLYLLLVIVALITFILIKVKKKKIFGYSLFLLLITILLPIGIFAVQRYEYDILFKNISIKGVMLPYDVKFHVLDKDPITEVVIYGDEIETLPEVNEAGYNFVEWQDKDGNKVDEHTVITGDLNVYAKLNLITYNINYDLNTGSLDEGKENPSTYNVESDDIVLNNPKKLGYNFAGWTGSNGETLQTDVTIEKGSIGDKNYKANFIARDDTKYTVIHRKQKLILTEYETAEVEKLRGVTDTTIRPQTKTYRGFVSPEPEDLTITADGDALLVYDYKRMYYDYLVDVNTDSTIPTGSYPFETEATISPKNIPGYTFDKWSDDETDNTRIIIIDENTIRLKPLYTPNPDTPYMVIHKYQKLDLVSYEEEVENKTGTTDTSVTPGIRIREGFENPTLQTVNINGDGSTVVTYIYNRKYYNFTLEDPNNTNSTLPTGSYPYETEITVSPKAIPGYTFDKWNDGNKEKPRTIILVEDTSIKPIYKPNTNTPYVVNHYKQKLTLDGYDLADTDNLTGTTDTKVTPNTKTYTGFTSPTKVEITIKGDGTTVLNYNYDRKNYSFSLTNRVDAEASVVDGSYPYETHIILDIHDKPGYDFVGWSDGDTNTRREIILTKDTEIGPVFNARTDTEYKVQHKKMNLNGSGYTLEETELLSGTTDTNVTPAVKTYTGFTSPSTKTAKIKGDGTTVIEYLYTRNKYQLTYGDKNYTDLDYSTAEGKYYYETEIKIKAKAKTGYTFKKWNNGDTNSTTTFNIVKDTTITPIYEANKYNVVFNSNTGTGTMSNQQMTYDVETELSKNTFTKTGYTFSKWNTKEDGTGTNYNDEATVKNLATSGNKILYAVWTANELVFNNQTLNTGTYGTAYTSNAFTGATNGTGDYKYTIKSGAPEGATINSTNRTISFPATTVAGTYNVVVTAKDNTSGKSKDATMKIVINTATPTVTLAPKSAVYTGSAIAANTATVSPNSNPTITYTYYNGTSCTGTALSGAPTNVGTYSVKAHAAAVTNKTNVADSACVTHTITQAPTTTTMSEVTKTYTGSAQAASGASAKLNSNNSSISEGSYTYTYYNGNSCSGTALSGAPVTAGTYSVKATLTATTNYASSTSSCALYTMNKSATTTTMSAITKTYNGSAQAASGATSKLSSNNTSISGGSYTYTYYNGNSCSGTALTSAPTNAGTYSVKATLSETTNYNESTSSCVTYTMNKKAITIKAKDQTITYGNPISKTTSDVTVATLETGDTLTGITLSQSTTNPTTSGKIIPSAAVIKKGTTDVTSSYSITYTDGVLKINDNPDTITITNKVYIYDGSGKATTASGASGSTVSLTYYSDSSCSTKTTTTNATSAGGTPKAVGTYYAIGTTAATTSYTAGNSGCKKAVEINNAKLTFDATTNGGTLIGTSPLYTRKGVSNLYTGIKNSTTATIPTVSKDGYDFDGWYTAPTGGSKVLNSLGLFTGTAVSGYTSTNAWAVTEDKTLYAQYTAKTIVITYNANGGSFNSSTTRPITYSYDTDVTSYSHTSNIDNSGTQNGNYANNLATKDVISIPGASSLHLIITYGTENSYDMLYVFEGEYTGDVTRNMSAGQLQKYMGSNTSPTTVELDVTGDTVTFAFYSDGSTNYYGYYAVVTGTGLGGTPEYEIPTKPGYIFEGWYTDTALTNRFELNSSNIPTDLSSNRTVYAKYREATATFDRGSRVNAKMKQLAGNSSATYSSSDTTITNFQRSTTIPNEYKTSDYIVSTSNSEVPIYMWFDNGTIYWYSDSSNVNLNSDSSYLFNKLSSITNIELDKFSTSNVTEMDSMFENCKSLTNLDVSHFDTSNVTNMSNMFDNCKSLTSLDVTHFDTSNVTNMGSMFHYCNALTSLDVTNFDTSNVTNMSNMFDNCKSLTSLDVTHFNTSNVTDMSNMFNFCEALASLDVTHFDTSNVTNMNSMFMYCKSLTSLDVTHFNTNKVTDMSSMFSCCSSLPSLDVSNFNTSNVTDMNSMFQSCLLLPNIDVSHFDTSKVTHMGHMFSGCSSLTELDVSHFDTSNVINMSSMFSECKSLTELDVSHFDTSNVKYMNYMFTLCENLTQIDVSHFNTSNVTTMQLMFNDCHSLTNIDVSHFDTSNVTNISAMFQNCSGLTELDISSFDTSNVKYMQDVFKQCSNLETIYASDKFITSNVLNDNDSRDMFSMDYNLSGGSGTTYSSSNPKDKTYARIDDPDNGNPGYFTYKAAPTGASISKVSNMIKNNGNKIVLLGSTIMVIILGIALKLVNRKKKS